MLSFLFLQTVQRELKGAFMVMYIVFCYCDFLLLGMLSEFSLASFFHYYL